MCEPKIVHQQDGLYKYVIYEDGDERWWKIHRPGDETPDYYDEYDGDLIADLLSWLHTQRDKAEAERDALRAEVERLREERRWRTFPANLPDANGRYVCMWADGDMYIQRWNGSKWLGAFDHDITHWMPLPASPEKEE